MSKISKRQIADGAIDNTKVSAGAAIDTNKLAEGSDFLKRTGTVALVGDLNAGNNKITNLGTPQSGSDAVSKNYVDAEISNITNVNKYRSARVASTSSVNIANPATSVFDGVTIVLGDRVLLKDQSTAAENGIYIFNGSSSAMTRATDCNTWNKFPSLKVTVSEGAQTTTNGIASWFCPVDDGGTLGTTAINFVLDVSGNISSSNFVDKEVPSGTLNGVNTAFTLAYAPIVGSELFFINGILQKYGAGEDYTISGTNLSLTEAPLAGEELLISYRK